MDRIDFVFFDCFLNGIIWIIVVFVVLEFVGVEYVLKFMVVVGNLVWF